MLIERRVVLLGLIALVMATACQSEGRAMPSCEKMTDQLRRAAHDELRAGVSETEIERFLTGHRIKFAFDRFQGRYQGILREVSNQPGIDCAVVAYIYTDESRRYIRSEFVPTYTGL